MCFFSLILVFMFMLSAFSVNLLFFYLLILSDILHQTNYFFVVFYFLPIIFPATSFIIFFILLHICSHIPLFFNWVLCTFAATSMMKYSCTSLYLVYQFYFTFLSLLTSLNFQSNFGPYWKKVRLYVSTSHTSHVTNIRAVSSVYQYIYDLLGYIFYRQVISRWPCESPYVDTMFPSQLNPFPVQNFPFIFHYDLYCCEDSALHMLDINRILFQL